MTITSFSAKLPTPCKALTAAEAPESGDAACQMQVDSRPLFIRSVKRPSKTRVGGCDPEGAALLALLDNINANRPRLH